MGAHLDKWAEETYAQLRLDGLTHARAIAEMERLLKVAAPVAAREFLNDVLGKPEDAKP